MTNDERLKRLAEWCDEEAEAVEEDAEQDDRFDCEGGCGGGKVALLQSLCPDCLRLIASTLSQAAAREELADRILRKLFVYRPSDATMKAEIDFGLGRSTFSPSQLRTLILEALTPKGKDEGK